MVVGSAWRAAMASPIVGKRPPTRRGGGNLRKAHAELGARVNERTVELANANEALQAENTELMWHLRPTPDDQEIPSLPPEPIWIKFKPAGGENSVERPADAARAAAPCKTSVPIIVADDDPVSRDLISSLTRKWGFRTIVTRDGHEAMAAIRAEQGAAVAILDWLMPGMDGLQVCQRVRATARMVYIILLTVRGGTENLVEGLECGADEYLVKPFDKSELLARIKVGLRILDLETHLANRVRELELASTEIHNLNLRMPL